MRIKEIIVVEGKDDTIAVKRALDADTIETNGSAINDIVIDQIKHAAKKRGVIIFTDPDFPGERIRSIISEKVPGCKHAFMPRDKAKAKKGRGLGIEHASDEDIRYALRNAKEDKIEYESGIVVQDLMDLGLIGGAFSKERRNRLGEILKIGHTNGKQLYKRLNMFNITKEEFLKAYDQVLQEENE